MQIGTTETVKPSRFMRRKDSGSLSPLPKIDTRPKSKKKKPKDSILDRRKCHKYTFEPNISDENDALEQRILKWLEDHNVNMVLPDDKEHDYIQSNISSVFQKFEKNSTSSVWTSNSNSSSPNKIGSISNSPKLNIQNSPLMKKRKALEGAKYSSVLRPEKSIGSGNKAEEEDEKSEGVVDRKTNKKPIEFFLLENVGKD